jgi:flagellin-like hook-associated protein FlgL
MNNQEYQYEFATRTYVTINSLAKNSYTDKMYADLNSLIEFANTLTVSDRKALEKYYSDPPNNLTGFELTKAVEEHMNAEVAKMNAVIHDRFNNMLYLVDRHAEQAMKERAMLGSRGKRLELLQARLEQDEDTYTALMAQNEDVDMFKAAILKASAEAAFQASLRASANIVQLSLANFIG